MNRSGDSFAVLTPIRDPVSQKVRAYYEEAPYPSYDSIPPPPQRLKPSALIRALNPWTALADQPWEDAPDILVAGCGTGQQAFRVAQTYPGAKVLAIDLSATSLAYAAGKYAQSGLSNIQFAQADILELPMLARSFDVIEVGGVLHHMADPWAGLSALVKMLRTGGYIRPALYSRVVREQIYGLRQWALANGFKADRDGAARFRQALMALPSHPLLDFVRRSPDFSTVDEFRDMVFHPQEQAVTIAEIAGQLKAQGLRFLGFCFAQPEAMAAFRAGGHGDPGDLEAWARFEAANPLAFAGMYDFWAQKLER